MNNSLGFRQAHRRRPWRLITVAALMVLALTADAARGQRLAPAAPPPVISGVDPIDLPGQTVAPYAAPGLAAPGTVGVDPDPSLTDSGPWDPGLGWSCGGSCPPSWRGRAEWLEFTRNRSGDSLSTGFTFNDFGYEEAMRITLDRRYDCTHGWEIVYAGPFNFAEQSTATALPGTLQATILEGAGINLSAFFDANIQRQLYQSRLQSVEAGYKSWGWNVIGVFWGTRYVNLNEQLAFRSDAANGDVGFIRVNTDNNLVLGQFGIDMLFPLGRWSFDTSWKGALGANVGSSRFFLSNAGVVEINRFDQDIEFAAMIEGGTYVRYFITPRLTVRAGYEFWWIHGVGLASRQFGDAINRNTGRDFRGTNEVTFYGASAGVEYVW